MINTRKLAYDAISQITKGGYSNLILKKLLPRTEEQQDRAFVTALVYGTIEKQITLDYQIKSLISKEKTPIETMNLLRLGAYQLFYMDSVPDFAAVDQTVEVAKTLEINPSFVNGVMRNLIRKGLTFPKLVAGKEIEYYSVKYSIPEFLIKKWKTDYGMKIATSLAEFAPKPYTSVRPNLNKTSLDELIETLENTGAKVEKGTLRDALRVYDMGAANNIFYNGGIYTIQGEGAMLGAIAAVPKTGNKVLDVCAAPGGKSIYISELKKDCEITAWDLHPHRVDLINANITRMGSSSISVEEQDSLVFKPEYEALFDSVIVDAPCSGLGTIWQKPEIRHRVKLENILTLNAIQEKILTNAAKYVKKGGILVYCTCTLSRSENDDIVNKFLEQNQDFEKSHIDGLPEPIEKIQKNGVITLLPYLFDTEGFFVARMRRKDQ